MNAVGMFLFIASLFVNLQDSFKEVEVGNSEPKELEKTSKKKKKNKKIKKGKKQQVISHSWSLLYLFCLIECWLNMSFLLQSVKDGESAMLKRPKKKLKL